MKKSQKSADVMLIRRNQTVGRKLCLLLVVCLLVSEVKAVENLEELQIFEDAITDRAVEDKSIDFNTTEEDQISTKPKLFKSQSDEPLGMDSLTIIWYLTTFTALLGFFVVMACTENSCNGRQATKPPENARTCPPSPCPSYKNFAPPSYESVMQKFKTPKVFIVPVHDNSFSNQSRSSHVATSTSTVIEIEKSKEITV